MESSLALFDSWQEGSRKSFKQINQYFSFETWQFVPKKVFFLSFSLKGKVSISLEVLGKPSAVNRGRQ